MWMLFGKPIRRWVIMSFLVPIVAAALSALGRYLQRRQGHETRTSRLILWGSRMIGGKDPAATRLEAA